MEKFTRDQMKYLLEKVRNCTGFLKEYQETNDKMNLINLIFELNGIVNDNVFDVYE